METIKEDEWIEKFYKQWCKETKRNGGVLIGKSIKELLKDFSEEYAKQLLIKEDIDYLEADEILKKELEESDRGLENGLLDYSCALSAINKFHDQFQPQPSVQQTLPDRTTGFFIMDEIIKMILTQNPKALLSGSHALISQGFKPRNPPHDIDIRIREGDDFVISVEKEDQGNDYTDKFDTYILEGVTINVFECEYKRFKSNARFLSRTVFWKDILRCKFEYCLDSVKSSQKHRDDIIYFFQNNLKNEQNL